MLGGKATQLRLWLNGYRSYISGEYESNPELMVERHMAMMRLRRSPYTAAYYLDRFVEAWNNATDLVE